MARCIVCGRAWRELEDEQGDHECPHCGPLEWSLYDREDESDDIVSTPIPEEDDENTDVLYG